MITKEQIERINELAKKQQISQLTVDEKKEQDKLRRIYVDSFKENLKAQLKNIKIVTPEEYEKNNSQEKCNCGHEHKHDHNCDCGKHEH
jgi:uncharacterized protein YnzC (UPF0291/DUF896 family)